MQRSILRGVAGSGRIRDFTHWSGVLRGTVCAALALSALSFATMAFQGDKAKDSSGFVTEIPAKESDVLSVVKEVAADTLVRGTYVYEKDKTLTGAVPAKTSDVFGAWQGPGTVFYKVLTGALAPRHFADSADSGTITVR
jgi:hypothetical protein